MIVIISFSIIIIYRKIFPCTCALVWAHIQTGIKGKTPHWVLLVPRDEWYWPRNSPAHVLLLEQWSTHPDWHQRQDPPLSFTSPTRRMTLTLRNSCVTKIGNKETHSISYNYITFTLTKIILGMHLLYLNSCPMNLIMSL